MSVWDNRTKELEPLEGLEPEGQEEPEDFEDREEAGARGKTESREEAEAGEDAWEEAEAREDSEDTGAPDHPEEDGEDEDFGTWDEADGSAAEALEDGEEAEEYEEQEESVRRIAGRTVQFKKRSRKNRRRNRILRVLAALLILAAFITVANLPYFQVQHIPVIGNKTVSDKKIRKLSGIRKGDKILLINPLSVSSRIKENLFIEKVKVDRDFPDTVQLIVQEREATAQVVMRTEKGKVRYVSIDESGMVMDVFKKKKKVTIINNIVATKAEPGSKIEVSDSGIYHQAMQLIETAKSGDVYFKRINIRGSMVRANITDDLVCEGRLRNVTDSINSGQLKTVVYKLYQEDNMAGIINIGDNNYCSFTPQN